MRGKAARRAETIVPIMIAVLFIGGAFLAVVFDVPVARSMKKFDSCFAIKQELQTAMAQARNTQYWGAMETMEMPSAMGAAKSDAGADYSTTNVQVAGVDEADIVKTDGEYVYSLSGQGAKSLVISRAYPPEEAGVLSSTSLGGLSPREMFIHHDMLLVFGSSYTQPEAWASDIGVEMTAPYPYSVSLTTLQLWDLSDRASPELVRSLDFEGGYVSSRKIGEYAYFVINSHPNYQILEGEGNIVPLYRDMTGQDVEAGAPVGFEPSCGCGDVGYFEPVSPESFVTVASISLADPDAEVEKQVVLGSGQNIYASPESIYLAESSYPFWRTAEEGGPRETTIVHKFGLDSGKISYKGNMEAPGRVLNQFSMDEYQGYFRIATTLGRVTRTGGGTSNNVYIFGENLERVGSLEDLAPGESIYSARFMGDRGYLVTFKKIDPFFVIDLSDPANPGVLGKLKIPGYSDYLHPYDENHIIGIGKETVEAEEDWGDFSWYQGVKMALFDVTDVENPVEVSKVIIGDRGTDSDVLHDHKAFLFDREKNLLVIPILLAEIKGDRETLPPDTYGDFVYQGAYVYSLTPEEGFELRGRVTHYDTDEPFMKSGYYFRGDQSIRRSLYIGDALYTLSDEKLKFSSLEDMSEIGELEL